MLFVRPTRGHGGPYKVKGLSAILISYELNVLSEIFVLSRRKHSGDDLMGQANPNARWEGCLVWLCAICWKIQMNYGWIMSSQSSTDWWHDSICHVGSRLICDYSIIISKTVKYSPTFSKCKTRKWSNNVRLLKCYFTWGNWEDSIIK